jgi:hypothetical protein
MDEGIAIPDVEYLVRDIAEGKDALDAICGGVTEENLTEPFIPHKVNELRNTIVIQLVENIIQQEQGSGLGHFADIIKLTQFQCHRKGLLLSLGAKAFGRETIDEKGEVVLVDAAGGKAKGVVTFSASQ